MALESMGIVERPAVVAARQENVKESMKLELRLWNTVGQLGMDKTELTQEQIESAPEGSLLRRMASSQSSRPKVIV